MVDNNVFPSTQNAQTSEAKKVSLQKKAPFPKNHFAAVIFLSSYSSQSDRLHPELAVHHAKQCEHKD